MHCVLLAELAALISQHGPAIIESREEVPPEAVTQYWASSRSRFELWHQTLSRYRRAEQSGESAVLRSWWRDHVVVLEEILVSELLTRVMAALACGLEDSSDRDEIAPVTHAVHLTHVDARNRVQQMMLFGRGNSVQDAVRLNRLRQGVERWTDALVGRMSVQHPETIRYAVQPGRAEEYARELRVYGFGPARDTASWLMNAAMQDMLRRRTTGLPALPTANRNVARSVMLMLRPELFDSIGLLKSLWLHRLQVDAERGDRTLDEAVGTDIDLEATAGSAEITHEQHFERWYM